MFLCSPPQPQCCFLKIRSKRLTPLLNTLPGPPFTWSKTQSPYRVRGCWPVEERGGSLAPPHLYVASPCLLPRVGLHVFPSVFLTHCPLCTRDTPVTFLPSPSEGPQQLAASAPSHHLDSTYHICMSCFLVYCVFLPQ